MSAIFGIVRLGAPVANTAAASAERVFGDSSLASWQGDDPFATIDRDIRRVPPARSPRSPSRPSTLTATADDGEQALPVNCRERVKPHGRSTVDVRRG